MPYKALDSRYESMIYNRPATADSNSPKSRLAGGTTSAV